MTTTTKTDEPVITFEFIGPGDRPTRITPGNQLVFEVDERGRFEAPAKYAQSFAMLGFQTLGTARVKPKQNGDSRGIGAHMGQDQSKKGATK